MRDALLSRLLNDVVAARATEKEQQGLKGVTANALANARQSTLRALDDYAAALESRCFPVPPRLQQEINLHRALCGTERPRR